MNDESKGKNPSIRFTETKDPLKDGDAINCKNDFYFNNLDKNQSNSNNLQQAKELKGIARFYKIKRNHSSIFF